MTDTVLKPIHQNQIFDFSKAEFRPKIDYVTDRTSFGQNAFLFAKIVPLLADTKPMLAARSATDWIFIGQKSLFWPKEAVLAKRNCLGQTPIGPYEAKTCLADYLTKHCLIVWRCYITRSSAAILWCVVWCRWKKRNTSSSEDDLKAGSAFSTHLF